nr:uncharacterized protein LOC113722624 [Coffea arabica]
MSFMEATGIFDVDFSGANFTWCSNRRGRARIWKRLDRVLINGECAEVSSNVSVEHLARHPSDHALLRISFATRLDNKPRPFQFLNVWTSKTDLLEVIRGAWDRPVNGAPLRVLCLKLMVTRRAIQEWNKHIFGNIFDAVRVAKAEVRRVEIEVKGNDSEVAQARLHKAQADLSQALLIEEQFWSQKSPSEDEDIANEAIAFFSDLFSEPIGPVLDMLPLIPPLITEKENKTLEEVPSIEEVRRVVFAMDGESAPGPDGLMGKFFTFSWDVIAQDVYNVGRASLSSAAQFICYGYLETNVKCSGALFLRSPVIPDLTFGDFVTNGNWNIQLLSQALPLGIISSILQQPIPQGSRVDKAV